MSLSFLHRLITGLVILWLAVFYPAMCQYHGLMLFRAATTSEHQHHHPPDMDAALQMAHSGHAAAPVAGSPAKRHTKPPVSNEVTGLVVMALPLEIPLWSAQPAMSLRAIVPAFAHQIELAPPDEPPRFLPV